MRRRCPVRVGPKPPDGSTRAGRLWSMVVRSWNPQALRIVTVIAVACAPVALVDRDWYALVVLAVAAAASWAAGSFRPSQARSEGNPMRNLLAEVALSWLQVAAVGSVVTGVLAHRGDPTGVLTIRCRRCSRRRRASARPASRWSPTPSSSRRRCSGGGRSCRRGGRSASSCSDSRSPSGRVTATTSSRSRGATLRAPAPSAGVRVIGAVFAGLVAVAFLGLLAAGDDAWVRSTTP